MSWVLSREGMKPDLILCIWSGQQCVHLEESVLKRGMGRMRRRAKDGKSCNLCVVVHFALG